MGPKVLSLLAIVSSGSCSGSNPLISMTTNDWTKTKTAKTYPHGVRVLVLGMLAVALGVVVMGELAVDWARHHVHPLH